MHPHAPAQPPRRRPIPRLAVAAIGAVIAALSPRVAAADGGDLRYDAFAAAGLFAFYEMGSSDYGLTAYSPLEIGVGGSATRRFGRFFDLGLGLQYDYVTDYGSGSGEFVHFVEAPMLATLVIPLGATNELRAGIGLGPAYGFAGDRTSRRVHVLGGSLEIALAFAQRIRSDGLGLCVQLGVRGDLAPELNAKPDESLEGQSLLNIQFPFVRAGVSWR